MRDTVNMAEKKLFSLFRQMDGIGSEDGEKR